MFLRTDEREKEIKRKYSQNAETSRCTVHWLALKYNKPFALLILCIAYEEIFSEKKYFVQFEIQLFDVSRYQWMYSKYFMYKYWPSDMVFKSKRNWIKLSKLLFRKNKFNKMYRIELEILNVPFHSSTKLHSFHSNR